MRKALVLASVLGLVTAGGWAKGKKVILPPYVLAAHTITVVIDPEAGISVDDPRANQVAQKDVETALLKWGRFEPVISTQAADLIVVVRKGSGKLVTQTITDPGQNRRAGMADASDDGVTIGGQHGRTPNGSDPLPSNTQSGVHPQMEMGGTDDSFVVYEGKVEDPLSHPPAWRYMGHEVLRSHNVPAVDEFRKMVAEAEKAASKNP